MSQSVLSNTIDSSCKCCEEVWVSLLGEYTPSTTLYSENTNNNHEWEISKDSGATWLFFSTGGTVLSIGDGGGFPPINIASGDWVRVKYTDTKGCEHYSNISILSL